MIGSSKTGPTCQCLLCRETFVLKNNRGIVEDYERLKSLYTPPPELSCTEAKCCNHGYGVESYPERYYRFGWTEAGSRRFRCRACKRLISKPTSVTPRQKRPEINAQIFRLLINKAPMRRILEVAGVGPEALYTKLRYLHDRCIEFLRNAEAPLLSGMELPNLLISVDRQDYLINWGTDQDRRNIRLHGMGSADNRTGFVFGMHLDYDSRLDPGEIEVQAKDVGDYEVDLPFRRYARLWLQQDWTDPVLSLDRRKRQATRLGVSVDALPPDDRTAPWEGSKLPGRGMLVRSEYTMMAHFRLLAEMIRGSPSVLIYMDQDAGFRAACHVAFQDRIAAETAESFFVRIDKEMSIDEKRAALAQVASRLAKARRAHPDVDDSRLRKIIMQEVLQREGVPKHWQDRWLTHPFPSMNEPSKQLCHLTDRDSLPAKRRAAFHLYGSLHGVDRFFMVLRRRCSLLERPVHSASNTGRVWYPGNPYRPWVVEHLLVLMRTAYNYHLAGEDMKTPAMRLGLADQPWSLEQILAGSLSLPRRQRRAS